MKETLSYTMPFILSHAKNNFPNNMKSFLSGSSYTSNMLQYLKIISFCSYLWPKYVVHSQNLRQRKKNHIV